MVRVQIRRTVGAKGQVVVPKDIRENLGLKPGAEVVFEVREGEVVLRAGADPEKFVEDFCNLPKRLKKIDIKKLKEVLEEEYEIR